MANEKSIVDNKVSSFDSAKQKFIQSIANPLETSSAEGKIHTLNYTQRENAALVAECLINLADSDASLAPQYYFQAIIYFLVSSNLNLSLENTSLKKMYHCLEKLKLIPENRNVSNSHENNHQLSSNAIGYKVNEWLAQLFADNSLSSQFNDQVDQAISETGMHPSLLGKIFFRLKEYVFADRFLDVHCDIDKVQKEKRGDAEAYYCLGYLKYFIHNQKIISLQFLFASALLKNNEALELLERIGKDPQAHDASRAKAKSYLAQLYTRQLSDVSILKMGEFSDKKNREKFFEKQIAVIKDLIQDDETFDACVRICVAGDVKDALGRFALENSESSSKNESVNKKLLSADSFIRSFSLIVQNGFDQDVVDLIEANYLKNPLTRTDALIKLIDFYLRDYNSKEKIPFIENSAYYCVNDLAWHYYFLVETEKRQANPMVSEIKKIINFMVLKVEQFEKWMPMPVGLHIFKVALAELELGRLQKNHLNQYGVLFKSGGYDFKLDASEIVRQAHHPLVRLLITTACGYGYADTFVSDMKACFQNNQFLLQFYRDAITALNSNVNDTRLLEAFEFVAKKTQNGFPKFLLACHGLITQKPIDRESFVQCLSDAEEKGCALARPLLDLLISKELAKVQKNSILKKTGKLSELVKKVLEEGSWVGKGKSMNDVVAGLVKQLELIEANGASTSKTFLLPTSKLDMFFACVKAFMDKPLSEYIQPNLAVVIYDLAMLAQQETFKNFQPAVNPAQNVDQNNNNNNAAP